MTADESQKHNSENDFIATKIVIDIAISSANDIEKCCDLPNPAKCPLQNGTKHQSASLTVWGWDG